MHAYPITGFRMTQRDINVLENSLNVSISVIGPQRALVHCEPTDFPVFVKHYNSYKDCLAHPQPVTMIHLWRQSLEHQPLEIRL